MAVEFINTTEAEFLKNKFLYKFVPFEYALQTLEGGYFWFANPLEWNDPFEKRYLNAEYKLAGRTSPSELPVKNRMFCMCATKRNSCEAFWSVYAPEGLGVGMQIDRARLLDVLNSVSDYRVFIGSVNYLTTGEITGYPKTHTDDIRLIFKGDKEESLRKQLELMMLKRVAFQYEDEFRVMLVRERKGASKGERVMFSGRDPIVRLTLDPRIGGETEKFLKATLKSKFGIQVVKSGLYAECSPKVIKIGGQ